MVLDLTEVMRALDGSVYKNTDGKDLTMGKILAGHLNSPSNENVRQLFIWSTKLWDSGKIEVDEAQIQLLESIVETAKDWPIVWKGRILGKIQAAKDKSKK